MGMRVKRGGGGGWCDKNFLARAGEQKIILKSNI